MTKMMYFRSDSTLMKQVEVLRQQMQSQNPGLRISVSDVVRSALFEMIRKNIEPSSLIELYRNDGQLPSINEVVSPMPDEILDQLFSSFKHGKISEETFIREIRNWETDATSGQLLY